jgi:hypothetical protein
MRGRRLLALAVLYLATTIASGPLPDTLERRSIAFEVPWNSFIRKLFGCPLDGSTTPAACHFERASIDYSSFRKACEGAKRLWGLTGECEK